MTLNNPSLELTFTVNDVQHGTSQTIGYDYIVNRSVTLKRQLLNGLKSSSDTLSLEITRNCISTEDIIATEGDIAVVLKDGNTTIFTGYISTNFAWTVGQTGEQLLRLTLETVGTRLLAQPYITTGRVFFDDNASSIIYNVCSKAGVTIASGHDRVLLQNVSYVVEADTTCKDILDQLFYECNACYYFDEYGHLCVYQINPSTVGAPTIDGDDLYVVSNRAVTLNKKLRQYKGARIQYWVHGTASNYLVYRNTTDGDSSNHCNLTLESGEYFDGTEIYTSQEWSDAQLDSFREPAYIGAVNASSESSIVGSNKIVSISNLTPVVQNIGTMTATFEAVGGEYFKLTAHNPGGSSAKFTQLDLKADIVYEKSIGVIRTNMTGTAVNKATLEEEMSWIHDKDNAQLHANMVSQYHQYSGSTYSFNTDKAIALGSVVRINDNVHTGLDVYVLVTGCTETYSDIINYTGVGVSTFNLNEDAFYQTVEEGKQSGAAGPQGSAGESVEVQYALGTSLTDPPTSEMQWGGADMLWDSDKMEWDSVIYTDSVPTLVDGYYIWMRQRVGTNPWQYSRLTGEEGEEAKIWDFTMDYETYKRNVRLSGFNPVITLKKRIQGYSTVGSWSCDHGTIVPYDSTTAHLSIPYNNNYDTLTVTLSDGTNTRSRTLNVIDVSNLDHDFGIWTSETLPVSYVDADGVTQPVYDGDFFVAGDVNGDGTDWTGDDGNTYKVGVPYIYSSSSWNNRMTATQANTSRMLQALGDVLNDPTIQPSSEALYGWFENLVAKNAVIEKLNATDALFANIHVSGKSQFDGNISSGAIETYDGSDGSTISIVSPSGSHYVTKATVMSALGAYGTYAVDDGTITINNLSTSTSTIYTATTSDPFQITFTGNSFAIKRTSDGVFLIKTFAYNEDDGYFIRTNDYDNAEITACSLVLADEGAGAMVSDLRPMDSTKNIGSSSEPFASGWFGSFVTTVAGLGSTNPEGHCTLTNGLELKWGNISDTENSGKTGAFHTYPDEQGGPFSNSTIHVIINQPQYCRFEWKPTPPADPLYPAEKGFRYVKYELASTSLYSGGNDARYLAIGY